MNLGITLDDLTMAIEPNSSRGEIDPAGTASQLGIDAPILLDAPGRAAFGPGNDHGNELPFSIEYAGTAGQQNVYEPDIRTAIETCMEKAEHELLDQAEDELGFEVKELLDAIGMKG